MKRLSVLLLLFVLLFSLVTTAQITISPASKNYVENEGCLPLQNQTLTATATFNYEGTKILTAVSSVDWLILSTPVQKTVSDDLPYCSFTYFLDINCDYQNSRTGYITVTANTGESATYAVTQCKYTGYVIIGSNPTRNISPSAQTLYLTMENKTPERGYINITSGVTASCTSWVHIVGSVTFSVANSYTIQVSIDRNTGTARTGKVLWVPTSGQYYILPSYWVQYGMSPSNGTYGWIINQAGLED